MARVSLISPAKTLSDERLLLRGTSCYQEPDLIATLAFYEALQDLQDSLAGFPYPQKFLALMANLTLYIIVLWNGSDRYPIPDFKRKIYSKIS